MLGGRPVFVVNVFVVVAAGLVVDAAVLHVGEGAEPGRQRDGRFDEGAAVEFRGVGIVVPVVAVTEDPLREFLVGGVDQVAEVVALELLDGEAGERVPGAALVVDVGYQAEAVLVQAFLAHEVAPLDGIAVFVDEGGQAVFDQFVVLAELLVVAVTVGVVADGGEVPIRTGLPGETQQMVVLPEVVRRAGPGDILGQVIALDEVTAVRVVEDGIILRPG